MKVRYYGHLGQMTGYDKAAEGMCMALLAVGVELEIRPLEALGKLVFERDSPLVHLIRRDSELTRPDAIIVHTLPLDCARVVELAGLDGDNFDIPLVAYTTWEGTSRMPVAISAALAPFDRVWTPSRVGADLMHVPTCVTQVMPHTFDVTTLGDRRAARAPSMDDGRFKFYYLGAWTCRKNPEGVIRAYMRAFGKNDAVTLIVRSTRASEEAFAMAVHGTGLAKTGPPVIFSNKPASNAAIIGLHRDADCFVTASRGEGWNLPAFEAVLAERHVISPAWLGSDEFLIGTSAYRYGGVAQPAGVDVRVKDATDDALALEVVGAQGQTAVTDWQEPDLIALANAMQDAYRLKTRQLKIDYDIADRFGYAAVGKLALTYLEAL